MRGLLIKDFKLLIKQKAVFSILLFMVLFTLLGNEDPVFGISYGMFLAMVILVGTIGYDDYDNSMSFLMTLPISRRTYAVEKYVLSLSGTFITGAVIAIVNVIYLTARPDIMSIGELLQLFAVMYCLCAVVASVYLPFQLRFGAEKGRLVLFALAGVVFGFLFLVNKVLPTLKAASGDLMASFVVFGNITREKGLLLGIIFAVIAVFVSVRVSIGILEKEEY